jgi:hypothetical protein
MQLQVECNGSVKSARSCWTCDRSFQIQPAKVIICNDQGMSYGEVCPQCINQGFDWIHNRFTQLTHLSQTIHQPKKLAVCQR